MSPSEIAFLAMGVLLGAAIGAALVEVIRTRPAPRREVRITISPNSVTPRRATTLAWADPLVARVAIPGSPGDDDVPEHSLAAGSVGRGRLPPPAETRQPNRTRVPAGAVLVPSTAVAVPVGPGPGVPGPVASNPRALHEPVAGGASPAPVGRGTTIAVLDPITSLASGEARLATPSRAARRAASGAVRPGSSPDSRARGSLRLARSIVPPTTVAAHVGPDPARASAGADGPARTGATSAVGAAPAGSEVCDAERHLVQERCALADAAREQARRAADALRDAQRAYDTLRERVERAQAAADPREIRASKDALHQAFRAARAAARTPDAVEAAARDWLNEINRLNTAARDAAHVVDTDGKQLRAQHPVLEHLALEADAARITSEGAEAGCREARETLALCEEEAARAVAVHAAAAAQAEEPPALRRGWPTGQEGEPAPGTRDAGAGPAGGSAARGLGDVAAIVRIVRGDRPARERLVTALAGADADAARQWSLRVAGLIDAIHARAIEDGYLDLPGEGFWGLFAEGERREIVTALSALGFRFDGLGGFADDRVPAQRDLSLAVGYAGLDRMRIRNWPRDTELAGLYAGAVVAADEWLSDQAGDLSLGRMVDALGARAAELADLWNAWGHVRPALLATD